jgi:hypothetical protein
MSRFAVRGVGVAGGEACVAAVLRPGVPGSSMAIPQLVPEVAIARRLEGEVE